MLHRLITHAHMLEECEGQDVYNGGSAAALLPTEASEAVCVLPRLPVGCQPVLRVCFSAPEEVHVAVLCCIMFCHKARTAQSEHKACHCVGTILRALLLSVQLLASDKGL